MEMKHTINQRKCANCYTRVFKSIYKGIAVWNTQGKQVCDVGDGGQKRGNDTNAKESESKERNMVRWSFGTHLKGK